MFVYGTLKRGEANHGRVAPFVREVREGRVPGTLIDLGGYPGWVDGSATVEGELLWLEPLGPALAALDELEGFFGEGDPRNEYVRVRVGVRTAGGVIDAWAYRLALEPPDAPTVPGGRWPAD
ncbi:MAG: gamma-glutamylcyclotransferase [Deltaproteobacteria bacterium]|nr:gamma-glutamylcyclotransferase [Deltaproteobacteria bacterium]